ncbi:Glutathione S-transferase kappa 1 [Podila epicladia]|nr:Glutathione S-transferase kappa 1 [Podila epicladia]KAG0094945.1 Glutathione S-transferase kappa 1 [Podila epicladia]
MTSRASIIFYYDLISPYTYMGFKVFRQLRQQWPSVDVMLKPVLLGGIMASVNNRPLFEFPSKRNHMIADLGRTSDLTGIPFRFPGQFPVSTVLPMRVLTAIKLHEADKYENCIDKDEYFVHGRNISQPEVIQTALAPIVGGKVQDMLQLATDPEIKKIFRDNTDEAVAKGAFGAPTLLVKQAGSDQEHLFFGSDRFESIAGFLNIPYPGLASFKSRNSAKL